jgi:uncharacterized protein
MSNRMLAEPWAHEKIQEMVRRIVAGFDPEKVILFGSFARGTAGDDSDVDLLVVKSVEGSKRRERVQIGVALQGMGLAKDIIVATPEEVACVGHAFGSVLSAAMREGRVLYERDSA